MPSETWELRIGGTDVCKNRISLDIHDGRAVVHVAVLRQLLEQAGWVRADEPAR